MKKQLKLILLTSKPLVFVGIILFSVVAYPIISYAASGWTFAQVTNWSGDEHVTDATNKYVAITKDATFYTITVYDFIAKNMIDIPKNDIVSGFIGDARISGENVIWPQQVGEGLIDPEDIYFYNIKSQLPPKRITFSNTLVGDYDIDGNWVAAALNVVPGGPWPNSNYLQLVNVGTGETMIIQLQEGSFINDVRAEDYRIFWSEEKADCSVAFMYEIRSKKITKINLPLGATICDLDVNGNTIAVALKWYSNGANGVYLYDFYTGKITQIVFSNNSWTNYGGLALSGDKLAYTKNGVLHAKEIHYYDNSDHTDVVVWAENPIAKIIPTPRLGVSKLSSGKRIIWDTISFLSSGNMDIFSATQI